MHFKKIVTYLESKDSEELLTLAHYLLNKFALMPEAYMLITLLIDEYKKRGSFSVITIPYFAMLIYSSLVVDYEKDKNINILGLKKEKDYE